MIAANNTVARKQVVKLVPEFEGVLSGIVTQMKDYQFCWHLNQVFGFDLQRMNDVEIIFRKKNKSAVFSLYRYEDEMNKWLVYVVANKSSAEYFLPEIKQADFILKIEGELAENKKKEIQDSIKKMTGVQLVTSIDFRKLKSAGNLVFE